MIYKIGDEVQIMRGAMFVDGTNVPEVYFGAKLVVKNVSEHGYLLGRRHKGPSIGPAVKEEFVEEYNEIVAPTIDPYYVYVTAEETALRQTPSKSGDILKVIPQRAFYKVVNEVDGWGKIEIGAGWINLADVKIIRHEEK